MASREQAALARDFLTRRRSALYWLGLPLIAAGLASFVVSNMPLGLPGPETLAVILMVNLLPIVGLVLVLLRKAYRIAAILILVPMVIAFVIGGYEHFLNSGPGSVFGAWDPQWGRQFRASAILLFVLELLGCWIGVQSWFLRTPEQMPVRRRA